MTCDHHNWPSELKELQRRGLPQRAFCGVEGSSRYQLTNAARSCVVALCDHHRADYESRGWTATPAPEPATELPGPVSTCGAGHTDVTDGCLACAEAVQHNLEVGARLAEARGLCAGCGHLVVRRDGKDWCDESCLINGFDPGPAGGVR